MANSGRAEGSHCASGLCTSSACSVCSSNFTFWCGVYWWVTRTSGTKAGVVHYKLQMYGQSSYFITHWLTAYSAYLNGGSWGNLAAANRNVNTWYDLGAETSQSFTYNDNGSAPSVTINGGGAGFTCVPYCRGSWTTTLGGFSVTPDSVTPDWNRKPGSLSASASGTSCTGTTITFAVGDKGVPSSITTQIQYGTTTSYGQSTTTSSSASGKFTLSNLSPATTYHYRVKTSNSTGTSYSSDYTFTTKGSKPTATTVTTSNPRVYSLKFKLSGINWKGSDGCSITSCAATLAWKYTKDGKSYSFTKSWTPSSDSTELEWNIYDDESQIPEDETVTYTWTLTTNIGTWTTTKTIYCMPQYEAYVCGPSTNYEWKECELYVSEKAGVKSYKKVRKVTSIT